MPVIFCIRIILVFHGSNEFGQKRRECACFAVEPRHWLAWHRGILSCLALGLAGCSRGPAGMDAALNVEGNRERTMAMRGSQTL